MIEKFNCTPLQTSRLILNDCTAEDFDELFHIAVALNKEARLKRCMPFAAFYTDSDTEDYKKTKENVLKYLNRVLGKTDALKDKGMYGYAIREKISMRLIGMIGFVFFPDEEDKTVIHHDLGYFISPLFQKSGFMTEAAVKVCQHFFTQFDVLEATTHPRNTASVALLQKLGAKIEKTIEHSKYNNEPRLVFRLEKAGFVKNKI